MHFVTLVAFACLLLACQSQQPVTENQPQAARELIQPNYELVKVDSPNAGERVRFLVIHFTGGDFKASLNQLTLVQDKPVSAHYLLPERDDATYIAYNNQDPRLKAFALVEENRRAWHAGQSSWEDRNNVNDQSIGIELVNSSTCVYSALLRTPEQVCFFHDYDSAQIDLLIQLSKSILARNPDISPTRVVGHSDVQPRWKNDPGPRFPWRQLYLAGIGAWYDELTVKGYVQQFSEQPPSLLQLQQALKAYGYGLAVTGEMNEETRDVIRAFQTHFVAHDVSGNVSLATQAILFALTEKYFPEATKSILAR